MGDLPAQEPADLENSSALVVPLTLAELTGGHYCVDNSNRYASSCSFTIHSLQKLRNGTLLAHNCFPGAFLMVMQAWPNFLSPGAAEPMVSSAKLGTDSRYRAAFLWGLMV